MRRLETLTITWPYQGQIGRLPLVMVLIKVLVTNCDELPGLKAMTLLAWPELIRIEPTSRRGMAGFCYYPTRNGPLISFVFFPKVLGYHLRLCLRSRHRRSNYSQTVTRPRGSPFDQPFCYQRFRYLARCFLLRFWLLHNFLPAA
jgi:hypothetical protein